MKSKILLYALALIVLATFHFAEAQEPKKVPRLGLFLAVSPSVISARVDAFRQRLRELGYLEGKNIAIDSRSAEGRLERLPPSRQSWSVPR
jgi:putative ABC transport system substrate-binding protein